jgi:hypothetical protein
VGNWANKIALGSTTAVVENPPLTIGLPHDVGGNPFNNSIVFWHGRWLMTYRRSTNLFIIELSNNFESIGKAMLLIKNAIDGRLCILNGNLYCSYSSLERDARCHMHICKLDDNLNVTFDKHFNPIKAHWEKNWVFCSLDGEIFCIYDYQPALTVWRMNEDFEIANTITRDPISWEYGTIRGNTPPILINGDLVMIVHSKINRGLYVNAVLRMTKSFDLLSVQKIDIDDFGIVFPCGLAERHGGYFVSYGIDDRACRVREVLI